MIKIWAGIPVLEDSMSSCMVLAEPPIQSSSFAISVLSSYILLGTLGPEQGYFLRITFGKKKSVT